MIEKHQLANQIINLIDSKWTPREKQQIPKGNWNIWLILAGRGFGKTRTAAETLKQWIKEKKAKKIALIGDTLDQGRSVMIEGESGLLKVHNYLRIKYHPSTNTVIWNNGAYAKLYSAENSEALRGPEFDTAWIDEFAKFSNPKKVWDQLMMCMRLGKSPWPRIIITTTPRNIHILHDLLERQNIHITRGTTWENSENLSETFLQEIQKSYNGTFLEKQEINGELVQEKNLWTRSLIKLYSGEHINFSSVIIAIDPAVTASGDETGIIVAGVHNKMIYILDDLSGNYSPQEWSQIIQEAYIKYNAHCIIAEVNQGGEMISALLPNLRIRQVRASTNKYIRAMPAAMLYQKNVVIHMHRFEILEKQMLQFESLKHSPDRVDALVWAIRGLCDL